MKRPNQHIIETISSKHLERIIPDEWVARSLDKDYGYDYLIEIFENNLSTGKTFFIQLKGTDQEIIDDEAKIQIKISNLKYFNKSLLPVLLVFFSTKTKQFWAIWANQLINTLNITENQVKKTIKLQNKNIINDQFFHSLPEVFSINIINKINFDFSYKNDFDKLYGEIIKSYLNNYYEHNIVFNDNTLPKSIIVNIENKDNKFNISISFNHLKKSIKIDLSKNYSKLYKPITNYHIIENEFKELLTLISIILIEVNTASSLEILRLSISDLTDIEYLLNVGNVAIKNKEFVGYQSLIEETIQQKLLTHYQMLNMAYIINDLKKNECRSYYQKNILKAINALDDELTKGIQYYNLANNFSNKREHRKAIKYYFYARKFNSDYTKAFYWWRELGAQLFLVGHYKIAEGFYRKYLIILENQPELLNPIIYALIGDCLFNQCKFSLAKEEFNIFFQKSEVSNSEWKLKNHICNFFIDNDFGNSIINKSDSLNITAKAITEIENNNIEKAIPFLNEAIKYNPANNQAWFNYATIMIQKSEYWVAQNAFLIAALFADWDKEAWINSLFLALQLKKDVLFYLILSTIKNKYGDTIKTDISEFIFKQDYLKLKKRKEIYSYIEDLYDCVNDSMIDNGGEVNDNIV